MVSLLWQHSERALVAFRFMRYLPMSYDVLCENVLDPSHVSLIAVRWSAEPGPCPSQAAECQHICLCHSYA